MHLMIVMTMITTSTTTTTTTTTTSTTTTTTTSHPEFQKILLQKKQKMLGLLADDLREHFFGHGHLTQLK